MRHIGTQSKNHHEAGLQDPSFYPSPLTSSHPRIRQRHGQALPHGVRAAIPADMAKTRMHYSFVDTRTLNDNIATCR